MIYLKNIKMCKYFGLVTREPYNYLEAKTLGCHIITIPPEIIEKIEKFGKSFDI